MSRREVIAALRSAVHPGGHESARRGESPYPAGRGLRAQPASRREETTPRLLTGLVPGAGSVAEVGVPCVIGRSERTDLTLMDIGVSRWHASVERKGSGWVIQDLGSRNGTFVNGKRVQVASLEDGDVIRVGNVQIVFTTAPRTDPPRESSRREFGAGSR